MSHILNFKYGTRHILDTLREHGRPPFSSLIVCGGLSKNELFMQTHADACGLPVLYRKDADMVLVGAAILGACACGHYSSLQVKGYNIFVFN